MAERVDGKTTREQFLCMSIMRGRVYNLSPVYYHVYLRA